MKPKRTLALKSETLRQLTASEVPLVRAGLPRGFCTDSCDNCDSLAYTCQGGSCGTPAVPLA